MKTDNIKLEPTNSTTKICFVNVCKILKNGKKKYSSAIKNSKKNTSFHTNILMIGNRAKLFIQTHTLKKR